MMSYEEMAANVLEARDRYEEKKKRRRTLILRCIPAAACLCIAAVLGAASIKRPMTDIPQTPDIVTETEVHEATAETSAAAEEETQAGMTAPVRDTGTAPASSQTATRTEAAAPVTVPAASVQGSKEQSAATAAVNTFPAGTAAETPAVPELPQTSAAVTVQTTEIISAPEAVTGTTGSVGTGPTAAESVHHGGQAGETTAPAVITWEDKPPCEQYSYGRIGDTLYKSWLYIIPEDMAGELLGSMEMEGYDFDRNVMNNCTACAYAVNGYAAGEAAAVRFTDGGELYFYAGPERTSESINRLIDELRNRKDESNES